MKHKIVFMVFLVILVFLAWTGVSQAKNDGALSVVGVPDALQPGLDPASDWQQVNEDNFGNPEDVGISALESFDGAIYAGASSWNIGAQVWRSSDGFTWTPVSEPGFSSTMTTTNSAIIDLIEFDGQLYASTGFSPNIGQIWRTPDGTTWDAVVEDGFGNPENKGVTALTVYSDTLYVSTINGQGLEIWRSLTGDSLSWTPVITAGFGYASNTYVTGFMLFNDYLYAAIEPSQPTSYTCQVWRSANGVAWEPVTTNGFDDPGNTLMGGWAILDGYLYIGTGNYTTGAQIWRTQNGVEWEDVINDGFGDINNFKIESVYAFDGYLFAVAQNNVTGAEVWRSPNGLAWSQINLDGFGDIRNGATLWNSATAVFKERLYYGFWSSEIWRYNPLLSAGFTAAPITGVAPLSVTFTNTTTGTLTAILWNFGDGLTDTLTNPVHSYTTAGLYTVTLSIESFGSQAAITRTNFITVYTLYKLYLPLNTKKPNSLLFFDDFSNPASGWGVDAIGVYEDGEFKLTIPAHGIPLRTAPLGALTVHYSVEVDVRRTAGTGVECGIMFDSVLGPSQYQFNIDPNSQAYNLERQFALIASGTNSAINPGDSVNHIKVERIGELINLYANSQLLTSLTDNQITNGKVGITAIGYTENAECRFDNFTVYQVP